MEGITHVRDLMRQVQVNLAYRWFIGYSLEEKLPDQKPLIVLAMMYLTSYSSAV